MTNPKSRRVGLEELALSDAADDSEENQITEADIRELAAYGFDSDDQTLVGLGISDASCSSTALDFDSDDRTLVGIGPVERAERASRARQIEEANEGDANEEDVNTSERLPPSEPPGPFISADEEEMPVRLPLKKRGTWGLAVPALLVAAGVVAVLRTAPRASTPALTAAAKAPQATANITPITPRVDATLEITAAAPAASSSVDAPVVPPPETSPGTLSSQVALHEKPVKPALAVASGRSGRADAPPGALDLSSNPPANVVLDGRPLGKAPRVVQIAPGLHTVVFIHPERGRMLVNVNVNPGETTTASADF